MNAGSSQIRVASPALEKRKLTVEFSNESPETVATLIAYALNLKCTRQGGYIHADRINKKRVR